MLKWERQGNIDILHLNCQNLADIFIQSELQLQWNVIFEQIKVKGLAWVHNSDNLGS